MPIQLSKDSPLFSSAPAKIGGSSDMAGTDYGVSAFTAPTSPIVTSSTSRTQYNQKSQVLDTEIANITSATDTSGSKVTDQSGLEKQKFDQENPTGSMQNIGGTQYFRQSDGVYRAIGGNTPEMNAALASGKDPNAGIAGGATANTANVQATSQLESDEAKFTAKFESWKTKNDAITNSLIEGIQADLAANVAEMTELNRQATARDTATGYAGTGGAARYAPQINDSVISDTVQKGMMRIDNLKAKARIAIAMAEQARNDKDLEQFYKYADEIKENKKAVTTELAAIAQAATSEKNALIQQAQEARAQQKFTDEAAQKKASSYASEAYKQMATLKTQKEKDTYLQSIATKSGVDPALLLNEVNLYANKEETQNSQIAARESAASSREQSISISQQRLALQQERLGGGGKQTATEKKDDAYIQINSAIEGKGFFGKKTAEAPNGTPYIDDEGYLTKEGFDTLVLFSRENGIPRLQFIKDYSEYIGKGGVNGNYASYNLSAQEKSALLGKDY